jgi:uncharacterized protein YbbK (DUF523 family)
MNPRIRLGVSACLLGQHVRYDGGHKLDRFLTETLEQSVEFVPVCPEVECGLPVPRETMHLVGDSAAPRLVTTQTSLDHTEQMLAWARKRVAELAAEGIDGFILKARSPSCGIADAEVCPASGAPAVPGDGLFTRILRERCPDLPLCNEVNARYVWPTNRRDSRAP